MECKNRLSIWLLAAVLILVKSENTEENEISSNEKHENDSTSRNRNFDDREDKEVSASHFVPSFGPIQPPDHYNPFQFHLFGPSPIHAYQYMFSHGYPYACTFPYNKFLAPFIPSQRDYFLDSQQPATFHYPHQHLKFPYAEHYPNYLPTHYHELYDAHLHHHHHGGFYPPHPVYVHQHYPLHGVSIPPLPAAHPNIPHNNPHSFHSVVNYGLINLHHGDHYEPHDNGKDVPFHPPSLHHHLPLPGFFPHYVPSTFLHHQPKDSPDEGLKPQVPVEDVDHENKSREVEKITPK